MARPKSNSVDTRNQLEVPISILQWMGMKSNSPPDSIPVNALYNVLNMDYVTESELATRLGTSEWMSSVGNVSIVGACEFHRKGDANSRIVFATSTGDLYHVSSVSSGQTPTLIGNITVGALTRVRFANWKGKLWIADGFGSFVYDIDTGLVTSVTLPSDVVDNIVDVMAQNSRLWWFTDGDEVVASSFNDPTNYETSTSWRDSIMREDGMSIVAAEPWLRTIVVTKHNPITRQTGMYKISGFSETTFRIDAMYSGRRKPTGFVGYSAVDLGNDIIGLTPDGFNTVSAIDTFNETSLNNLSKDVDDVVRRINWDYSHLITATYDSETRQYLCACPIDNADYNNIVFVFHPETQRWGLYDNWEVREFFRVGGDVFFGTNDGRIIKTREGDNDLGSDFSKIVETAEWHFDSPETLKLFKQVDLQISQDGEYNVEVVFIIEGNEVKTVPVTIDGVVNWDEFYWDVDPWDSPVDTRRTILPMLRGKTLRIRIQNLKADEPFSLRSLTVRSYITDAGSVKN